MRRGKAFNRINFVCNYMYVSCVSVCHMITFESFRLKSSFFGLWVHRQGYGSSSYMKVMGSMSKSQEHKGVKCNPAVPANPIPK